MDSSVDVIILGAGASGLMCAMTAAERGRRVLLLDHGRRAGQKVLVSGGGRCNFSNWQIGIEHYVSENPRFCQSALHRFTPERLIALLDGWHIPWEEREEGQLFLTVSAAELVNGLLDRCKAAGVWLLTHCPVEVVRKPTQFEVETGQGVFRSDALVVATGGRAMPELGASDFALNLARQFGLAVISPKPGLVPFVLDAPDQARRAALAGIAVEATVTVERRVFSGALLFTHRGLSGPAALQASNHWMPGGDIVVDLIPGIHLEDKILTWKRERPRSELKTLLSGALPKRLLSIFLDPAVASTPLGQLGDRTCKAVARSLNHWTVRPSGTEGYAKAEVMLGGVDTRGLSSKTFEANAVPGLYVIGEALDVTGWLGGYNLHWAWASGFCAGQVV